MIKVKNDWSWVVEHVEEELKDEELFNDVHEFMTEKRIDLDRVKELYHDGIEHGIEDGKYLPFSEWFYEYTN